MSQANPAPRQFELLFEERAASSHIWAVHDLVQQARDLVERQFADVWVEGEVSNCRPAPSGHTYFTLKDDQAQLPVVLFRRQALLLRFRVEDGLRVVVRGRVSVYEQRGQMQLVADTMEPVGAGSLQLAFEQLKEQLRAEGLFQADRKKPLPAFPRTVGIVTSPSGAVIRDFLNIVSRRHSSLNVLLFPVTVQGEAAPAEIESALSALNRGGLVDLIVLARGGGSLEDFAAFNSERVARAISASELPVVSAVGHETDFTIADFVADLRAPTPSAAAELVTEAQHKITERIDGFDLRIERAMRFQFLQAKQRVHSLRTDRTERQMTAMLRRIGQRLDDAMSRQDEAMLAQIQIAEGKVRELSVRILHHDPRFYLALGRERLSSGCARLERAWEHHLGQRVLRLEALGARLDALSPIAVLDRGYALVSNESGALVRSVAQIAAGERLTTRLADGTFVSRVQEQPAETGRAQRRRKK